MAVLIDCLVVLAFALIWFGVVGLTLWEMGHLLGSSQSLDPPPVDVPVSLPLPRR